MRVIVDYRPFVVNQLIYVYDDQLVDCITAPLPDMLSYIHHLVTKYGASEIIMYGNRNELSRYNDTLAKYEKTLNLIASMNNPMDEKMEIINETNENIDEVNEIISDLKNGEMFFVMLLWMIEEADATKYRSDKSKQINPDDYIYAGIECSLPDDSDSED